MNLLSIDVAITKPAAYALYLDDKLSCFDKVPGIDDIEDILSMIADLDLIVTEDMYHKKNIAILKKLCYEVGKVIYIANTHGIKYKLIRPVDWKTHHGLTLKNNTYISALQKHIILKTTGFEVEDDDIQSAILIGLYVIERARLGME